MFKLFKAWLNNELGKKYIIYFGQSKFNTPSYGAIGMMGGKKIMQQVYSSDCDLISPNEYTREEIEEVDEYYMKFAYDAKDGLPK